MTWKNFFVSWDFTLAILIASVSWFFLPDVICGTILKDLYSSSISVLSILFSMFFAALAIIISLNDNNFINFLEEDGYFSKLLSQFRFSLSAMFLTLIIALCLYGITIFSITNPFWGQEKLQINIFIFAFFYSLFAVFLSALDAIRYLQTRLKFIKTNRK